VPIGTDTFVRNFVDKTCRSIIDDVEKLDGIQDGFVHYQLFRFFHHHVDCKIGDTLLKKGTKIIRMMSLSILLFHGLWIVLVLSPRNVRTCDCLRMIFRTRPHGHRPRFYSSVTSTPSFSMSTIVRRESPERVWFNSEETLGILFVPSSGSLSLKE
jgi:hypothetical protein